MAQLVEHHLAKVRVAGSSPVIRSEELGEPPSPRHLTGGLAERLGTGLQSRLHRFESGTHLGRLAQGLERLVHTEEVTGSIPVSPTG